MLLFGHNMFSVYRLCSLSIICLCARMSVFYSRLVSWLWFCWWFHIVQIVTSNIMASKWLNQWYQPPVHHVNLGHTQTQVQWFFWCCDWRKSSKSQDSSIGVHRLRWIDWKKREWLVKWRFQMFSISAFGMCSPSCLFILRIHIHIHSISLSEFIKIEFIYTFDFSQTCKSQPLVLILHTWHFRIFHFAQTHGEWCQLRATLWKC